MTSEERRARQRERYRLNRSEARRRNNEARARWKKNHPGRAAQLSREYRERAYGTRRAPKPQTPEQAERQRQYRLTNREAIYEQERQRGRRGGSRRGRWTPAEDRIVMRSDLSLTELAYMLDRTVNAVTQRRKYWRRGGRYPQQERAS